MTPEAALQAAKQKAGSASNLAAMLGVSRQAVSKWKRVPIDHVARTAQITGMDRDLFIPGATPPRKRKPNGRK